MSLLLILLGLVMLPLVEIGVFIAVGSEIGVLWTLALVILATFAGIALVRRQSFQALQSARAEARAGRVPEREIVHGAMLVLAGLLLIVPGFVTDLVALLLLTPPLRDLIWRSLRSRIVVKATAYGPGGPVRTRRPGVVDLSEGEFERREPDPASPWREIADSDASPDAGSGEGDGADRRSR